jgi:hypothetical protein
MILTLVFVWYPSVRHTKPTLKQAHCTLPSLPAIIQVQVLSFQYLLQRMCWFLLSPTRLSPRHSTGFPSRGHGFLLHARRRRTGTFTSHGLCALVLDSLLSAAPHYCSRNKAWHTRHEVVSSFDSRNNSWTFDCAVLFIRVLPAIRPLHAYEEVLVLYRYICAIVHIKWILLTACWATNSSKINWEYVKTIQEGFHTRLWTGYSLIWSII